MPPLESTLPLVSVREAFEMLPEAERFRQLYASDVLMLDGLDPKCRRGLTAPNAAYASEMRANRIGFEFERPWNGRALTGMALTVHQRAVVRRFASTPPGGRESISRYLRLDWSGQSPTLRSGTARDHGSHTPPRPIHPNGKRVITVREAARLHSFPDWFAFHATKWHAWRGIGNSVPPRMAHGVAARLADMLDVRPRGRHILPPGDPRTIGYQVAW